ncbi:hypothetical protein V6N11_047337 [Hibiscus sabdariffa]
MHGWAHPCMGYLESPRVRPGYFPLQIGFFSTMRGTSIGGYEALATLATSLCLFALVRAGSATPLRVPIWSPDLQPFAQQQYVLPMRVMGWCSPYHPIRSIAVASALPCLHIPDPRRLCSCPAYPGPFMARVWLLC